MAETPTSVRFHYIKSPLARDLHINGVYGGSTPAGDFCMSVFSERFAIPTEITYSIDEGGILGGEVARDGRDGVVRLVQDSLYMDLATAMVVHKWLGEHIQKYLEQHPELKDMLPKDGTQ